MIICCLGGKAIPAGGAEDPKDGKTKKISKKFAIVPYLYVETKAGMMYTYTRG